jgi:integrase/recombinase XerD
MTADLLEVFVEDLRLLGRAPRTIELHRDGVLSFLAWAGGQGIEDARAVTREHLDRYVQDLHSGNRYAPSTIALKVRSLVVFFRWLEDSRRIFLNPAAGLREPKVPKNLPEVLTSAEVERILKVPDTATPLGLRDRAVLELLYGAGLRIGEQLALDLDDIQGDLVHVRRGKGGKARAVPMGTAAAAWIDRYLQRARPLLLHVDRPTEAIFLAKTGRRLSHQLAERMVSSAARAAGVTRRVTPHTLRHTFATEMVRQGIDVVTLARMMGHASVTTTQVYTRVVPRDLKKTHRATHPRERSS